MFVSWEDAQAFIERLNALDAGSRYRLPTEAEWEYACRAGNPGAYCFGDDESQLDDYAWYEANAWLVDKGYAHRVGHETKPNDFGLYDMHGNVWEWVEDRYGPYASKAETDPTGSETGPKRVCRGGSFFSPARRARSAHRQEYPPDTIVDNLGFRLVRVVV